MVVRVGKEIEVDVDWTVLKFLQNSRIISAKLDFLILLKSLNEQVIVCSNFKSMNSPKIVSFFSIIKLRWMG